MRTLNHTSRWPSSWAPWCRRDAASNTRDGFDLVQHPSTLEANLRLPGRRIAPRARRGGRAGDRRCDLRLRRVDYRLPGGLNQGVGDFMPNGDAIDAAQMKLVNGVLAQLESQLPDSDPRHACQDVPASPPPYMERSQPASSFTPFTYVSLRGWTHISCGCGYKYIGAGHYGTAGRGCGCGGGNGCHGRCGARLGGRGSFAYTQDCVSSRQGPHQLRHGGRRLHVRR